MDELFDIVMSVHPRHAKSIIGGKKTVELRRRAPRVPIGSRVWFYSTLPTGKIEVRAEIKQIVRESPLTIWKTLGDMVAISKFEFMEYFGDLDIGAAVILGSIQPLSSPVKLSQIKSQTSFHPPQYFSRIKRQDKIHKLLMEGIRNSRSIDATRLAAE